MSIEGLLTARTDAEHLIADRLRLLTRESRVAFALSCSERLFPVYEAFFRKVGWGDVSALRRSIDQLWDVILKPGLTPVDDIEKYLISLAPDSDQFVSPLTGLAQYSIIACVHAYEEYFRGSEGAFGASRVSFDCLLEYVEWVAGPIDSLPIVAEYFDWFAEPLVQCEIRKQIHDLDILLKLELSEVVESRLKTEGFLGIQPKMRSLL